MVIPGIHIFWRCDPLYRILWFYQYHHQHRQCTARYTNLFHYLWSFMYILGDRFFSLSCISCGNLEKSRCRNDNGCDGSTVDVRYLGSSKTTSRNRRNYRNDGCDLASIVDPRLCPVRFIWHIATDVGSYLLDPRTLSSIPRWDSWSDIRTFLHVVYWITLLTTIIACITTILTQQPSIIPSPTLNSPSPHHRHHLFPQGPWIGMERVPSGYNAFTEP